MGRFVENNKSLDFAISTIVDEETKKFAMELKKEIGRLKKNQSSMNTDYYTGYISALSTMEGYIVVLEHKEDDLNENNRINGRRI